jgi:ubiquinone/menaquinone biosynthesis C-methylase UbiE
MVSSIIKDNNNSRLCNIYWENLISSNDASVILNSIAKELFEQYPYALSHAVLRSVEMYLFGSVLESDNKSILLDLGCGDGIFFSIFKKKFQVIYKKLIGIDVNGSELKKAAKLDVYDDLICCDVRVLPFKDNSIDICISVSVLEHVLHYPKVLTEAQRVLKEHSVFYTSVVNAEEFSSNFVIPKILGKLGIKGVQKSYIHTHKTKNHHLVNNHTKDWLFDFQRSQFSLEKVIGVWTPDFIYASSKLGILNFIFGFFPQTFRAKWIKNFFNRNEKKCLSDPTITGAAYIEAKK